jgi:hypothetical protein
MTHQVACRTAVLHEVGNCIGILDTLLCPLQAKRALSCTTSHSLFELAEVLYVQVQTMRKAATHDPPGVPLGQVQHCTPVRFGVVQNPPHKAIELSIAGANKADSRFLEKCRNSLAVFAHQAAVDGFDHRGIVTLERVGAHMNMRKLSCGHWKMVARSSGE